MSPNDSPSRLRPTRQRTAVAQALEASDGFCSAQQLHARMRQGGEHVGLATVYRTLQALADCGEVDALHSDEGETVYRACSTGHHHHLVCRSCGKAVEVSGPPAFERWAAQVAREHGFSEVTHTLEVFGLCAECAQSEG